MKLKELKITSFKTTSMKDQAKLYGGIGSRPGVPCGEPPPPPPEEGQGKNG